MVRVGKNFGAKRVVSESLTSVSPKNYRTVETKQDG